ncbi:MAG TPA: hypothetical protein VGN57_15030 [Pirellulaceae bacterium]|jgi:hypothetical protein|nr:hypothetical protein [Pirellulaceae bacterium]
MRVSIRPQYSVSGLSYALRVGETTTFFRNSGGGPRFSEWTGAWLDGRSIQLRVPLHSAFARPDWSILLGGEAICAGVLRQPFWPTRTSAVAWTYKDEELQCRFEYGVRAGLWMRRIDGSLLAQWKFRLCSIDGVVRHSAGDELVVAAVAIALSALLISED